MHHRITVLIANLFQLRNEPLPDITFNRRATVLCGPHFDGRMTAIHPLIEFSPGQCHNSNYLHLWIDHNLRGASTIYTVALRNHPQLHLLPCTEVSNVRSTDLPEGMIQCSFDKRFCEVPKLFHGNGRYTPYVVFHQIGLIVKLSFWLARNRFAVFVPTQLTEFCAASVVLAPVELLMTKIVLVQLGPELNRSSA